MDDRSAPITVDVWSDVVCPFCYLGLARLQQAIDDFPHPPAVEVRHHSFQLNPDVMQVMSTIDYLVGQRSAAPDQVAASHRQLTAQGAEVGIDLRFERALVANTRDAHRLIHRARAAGCGQEMVMRLFRAEFTDGLDVSDHGVLTDLAEEVGLAREETVELLRGQAHLADVEADRDAAAQLGVSGVPFFVLDGRRAISGAQPLALFRRGLELSWQDRAVQAK